MLTNLLRMRYPNNKHLSNSLPHILAAKTAGIEIMLLSPYGSMALCPSVCLLRHVRREWALLLFHLFVCLSVIPRPTAYHDWSITTKFGRQVYTCPRTRVSLFGSHISHTFGARGKNMQNFANFQRVFLPLRTWRIVPYDLSVCLSVCLSQAGIVSKQRKGSSAFMALHASAASHTWWWKGIWTSPKLWVLCLKLWT